MKMTHALTTLGTSTLMLSTHGFGVGPKSNTASGLKPMSAPGDGPPMPPPQQFPVLVPKRAQNKLTKSGVGLSTLSGAGLRSSRLDGVSDSKVVTPSPDGVEEPSGKSDRMLRASQGHVPEGERRVATEAFFKALDVGPDMPLNKSKLAKLLDEDFALAIPPDADLGDPNVQRVVELRKRIEKRIGLNEPDTELRLGEISTKVQEAVIENQKPLSEFLAIADVEPLTNNPIFREAANDVAHHVTVLEAVIGLEVEDVNFMQDIRHHFYHQREAKGLTPARIAELSGFFGMVKTLTIDQWFQGTPETLTGIEQMRIDKQTYPTTLLSWGQFGVPVNIAEAGLTDLFNGRGLDAQTAFRLAKLMPDSAEMGREPSELLLGYPEDWSQNYETWNLKFVFNNLKDPQKLAAKLLIPSVAGADDKNYIYRRGLGLWTTIQTYLISKDMQKAAPLDLKLEPQTRDELNGIWETINDKFVRELEKTAKAEKSASQRNRFGSGVN